MSLKRRLISASVLNLADYALKIGVVLAVSPFLISRLGQEDYGLWVLLLSIIGYFNLLDLGLSNTAVKYLSGAVGAGDVERQSTLFAHFRRVYRKIGTVSALMTVVVVLSLPFFITDARLVTQSQIIIGLGGLMTSCSFFLRVYSALLKSHVLYHKIILAGIARLIVYTGLMILVLVRGGGLIPLAFAWMAGMVVELIAVGWMGRQLQQGGASEVLVVAEQKEIRGFASKILGLSVAGFMRDKVDTQVLALHLGMASVTQYSVGSRLVSMFADVINAIFGSHFLAAISQVQAKHGSSAAAERLIETLKFSGPLALLGGSLLFILGPAFIDCWLGEGFETSHSIVRFMAFPLALTLMQYPVGPFLGSMNRHGPLIAISLIGATCNLIGSLILVRTIGFDGVVIATAVELCVTALILRPWVLLRVGVVKGVSYGKTILRPLVVLVPAALLLDQFLAPRLVGASWIDLAVAACLLTALILGLLWAVVFDAQQRVGVTSLIRRRSAKVQ
jgi:O-antigen/teichoic acid export membrane protein